jgi:hypothetical protein
MLLALYCWKGKIKEIRVGWYVYLFILFIFIYVLISVLVRRGSNGKAELVLLDHGLYEYLPSSVRQPLCRLWKAIVTNSHADMKTYASELGVKGIVLKLIGPHIKVNMTFVHMCCVAGKQTSHVSCLNAHNSCCTHKSATSLSPASLFPALYCSLNKNLSLIRNLLLQSSSVHVCVKCVYLWDTVHVHTQAVRGECWQLVCIKIWQELVIDCVICSRHFAQVAAALCSDLCHWENGCDSIHCSRVKGDEGQR